MEEEEKRVSDRSLIIHIEVKSRKRAFSGGKGIRQDENQGIVLREGETERTRKCVTRRRSFCSGGGLGDAELS